MTATLSAVEELGVETEWGFGVTHPEQFLRNAFFISHKTPFLLEVHTF